MTAAHCIVPKPFSVVAVLGEHDLYDSNDGQVNVKVSKIIKHPNYDFNDNFDYGKALFKINIYCQLIKFYKRQKLSFRITHSQEMHLHFSYHK